jgi:hypothetical protein
VDSKRKERWRIRTNNYIKEMLEDTVKFVKSLRLRWSGHVERMQYQQMAKKLQQLQWTEKEKLEDNEQDGETSLKRIYVQWGQKNWQRVCKGKG